MNKRIVGKCSICGGVVSIPTVFWSTVPPVATCEKCGATEDRVANLPVIPMVPRGKYKCCDHKHLSLSVH